MISKLFVRSRRFALKAVIVIVALTLCAGLATAATTISTDIQTGGTLSVTGTSTLTSNVGIGPTAVPGGESLDAFWNYPSGGIPTVLDVERAVTTELSTVNGAPTAAFGTVYTPPSSGTCYDGNACGVTGISSYVSIKGSHPSETDEANYAEIDNLGTGFIDVEIAGDAEAYNQGAGSVNNIVGFQAYAGNDGTGNGPPGSTVDAVYAQIANGSGTGTIGDATALHAGSPDSASHVTNLYGLLVDDQTGATNNYAIKTGLGTVSFGDHVGIGSTSPAYGLSIDIVTGAAATSTISDGSSTHPSCLQLYAPNGTGYAVYVSNAGTLTATAGSCR